MKELLILGAGITGLSTSYELKNAGIGSIILEKEDTYGGLCSSFEINGFTFDTFAHISFDNDPDTYALLEGSTDHWIHSPDALNFCDGNWVRNPVQNNLIGLPVNERIRIIQSFLDRPGGSSIKNYMEWLVQQFGEYFAGKYPYRYTRKYWTVTPDMLDYKWIHGRMTTPDIETLLRGAMEENRKIDHYSKEARYPKKGGFQSFLKPLLKDTKIRYKTDIKEIDAKNRVVRLKDGKQYAYDSLVSTIPLNELCFYLKDIPSEIIDEAKKLDYTSGVMVSLGLKKPQVSPALWFYIYDEDILPSRVYAPDWKSPGNVPEGCSALQAEIYYSKYRPVPDDLDQLKSDVIDQLIKLRLFDEKDLLFSDIRFRKYANIMFTPSIYEARTRIHQYLDDIGIIYAGRWGEWDYLWVGQSLRSGKKAAERVIDSL